MTDANKSEASPESKSAKSRQAHPTAEAQRIADLFAELHKTPSADNFDKHWLELGGSVAKALLKLKTDGGKGDANALKTLRKLWAARTDQSQDGPLLHLYLKHDSPPSAYVRFAVQTSLMYASCAENYKPQAELVLAQGCDRRRHWQQKRAGRAVSAAGEQ